MSTLRLSSENDYEQKRLPASTANQLAVRPIPHPGESLRGYLHRLASDNGYDFTRWLYDLEPCLRRISDETTVIEAITRLTGHQAIKPKLLSSFGSNKLPAHFRALHPRICPVCVKERGYYDGVWEIAFVCACPHHGIMLVDTCPHCCASLTWSDLGTTCSNCGKSLIDADPVESGIHLQYLNAKIYAAAGRDVSQLSIDGFPDKKLSKLSLKQLCQLFLFVMSHENGTISMKRAKPGSIVAAAIALEAVSSFLSDWPHGFHRHLVSQRKNNEEYLGEGLQQVFGKLYIHLYGQLADKEYSFIRDAFEAFIGDNWFGVISGTHRRVNRDKVRTDAINMKTAARTLGIGRRSLERLVRIGLVKGNVTRRPSGRCRILVSELDTRRFSEQVGQVMSAIDTRKLLGISKKQFYMLVKHGVIDPVLKAGEEGCGKWWFDAKPINKLLHEIRNVAPHQEPSVETISFREVCQGRILSAEYFPAFVAAMLNGTVAVVGVKSDTKFNLASLYFLPESIAEFRAGLKIRQAGTYSIPEAAIRMGVKQEVAYHLVNTGLIVSSFDAAQKRAGRMISESSLKAFETEFVDLAQLARLHGTSPRALKQKYDAAGISAITGRDVDGCRQIFYRRADFSIDNSTDRFLP